eukprot:SAG11_NODE_188_length_13029_cov_3.652514_5_plen_2762_part_00
MRHAAAVRPVPLSVAGANRAAGINSSGRNAFVDKVKDGRLPLKSVKLVKMFFSKVLEKPTPQQVAEFLGVGCDDKLKEATMMLGADIAHPLQLIERLGAGSLTGVYHDFKVGCYQQLYDAAQFKENLNQHIRSPHCKDHRIVIWFLTTLGMAKARDVDGVSVKDDPLVLEMVDYLSNSSQGGTKELVNVFVQFKTGDTAASAAPELVSIEAGSLAPAMRPPGTREHDNDKVDFRDIQIMPTPKELDFAFTSDESPYLPGPEGCQLIDNAEVRHMDRIFRLMREDLLQPLRTELKDELKKKASAHKFLFAEPHLLGVQCLLKQADAEAEAKHFDKAIRRLPDGHKQTNLYLRVKKPHLLSKRTRGLKHKDACEFFEKGFGSKVFQKDILVALLVATRQQIRTIAIGVVSERFDLVPPEWKQPTPNDMEHLTVGVSFSGQSLVNVLPYFVDLNRTGAVPIGTYLFSASAGFFNYDSVLRSLQQRMSLPFVDSLLQTGSDDGPPDLPHGGMTLNDCHFSVQEAVKSDPTQADALQSIFDRKVALVQGPPGTGKSYVGVQMVKSILMKAQDEGRKVKILCLCYTNHALDSFMEELIDSNIPPTSFVRMGFAKKVSPAIQSRCMSELQKQGRGEFDRDEKRTYAVLRGEQEKLQSQLAECLSQMTHSKLGSTRAWWEAVREFLDEEYPLELEDLQLPGTADGFTSTLQPHYLWERWFHGRDRGNAPSVELNTEIWDLTKDERDALVERWGIERCRDPTEAFRINMEEYTRINKKIACMRDISNTAAVQDIEIIGCTCIYAAKHADQLAVLAPDVLLTEEAGEIFEAQTLAAISSSCKQIIAIGDHMQLRPKAECYELRKESGKGFNVDESMFERLILSGLPLVTLNVQHRMRPEFSRIVRETMYPRLEDAPRTLGRSNVQGIASNLVFLDHRHAEESSQKSDYDNHTRINQFEVDMVVAITMHLLRQNREGDGEVAYDSNSITILTPYLGQLRAIREKLQSIGVVADLSDLDTFQMRKEFGDDALSTTTHRAQTLREVRVATVDNFQGEQSDIMLISLVRSNRAGDIGFLSSKERVNVMLSRARHGQIIIGNLDTFTNCRKAAGRQLWTTIQSLLEEEGQIFSHFPALCPTHGTVTEITDAEDFANRCPNGGCNQICVHEFECGHKCDHMCHPHQGHDTIKCSVFVKDKCSEGHTVIKKCGGDAPLCKHIISWRCPLNHVSSGPCHKGKQWSECIGCDKVREREKADLAEEERMRIELDRKYEALEQLKLEHEQAKSKQAHQEELQLIEEELALAKQALEESMQPVASLQPALPLQQQATLPSQLERNMSELLRQNDLVDAASLADKYRRVCGNVLLDDVTACLGDGFVEKSKKGKKPRLKLRKVLEKVACSEIVMVEAPNGPQHPPAMKVKLAQAVAHMDIREPEPEPESTYADMDTDATPEPEVAPSPPPPASAAQPVTTQTPTAPAVARAPVANVTGDTDDEVLQDVLSRYSEHGALAADNLLDQENVEASMGLRAVQYIIRTEMDPHGELAAPSLASAPIRKQQSPLCLAVCAWAEAISRKAKFPLRAREKALVVIAFAASPGNADCIPSAWLESARDLEATATRRKVTTLPKAESVSSKWKHVEQQDSNAPKVMRESVLSMIGLEAVKDNMLAAYYRIKIAREQGDGSAASYNIRFEGNPGTGKTTIARLYGTFLRQLQVLPEKSDFHETSGAKLIQDGVKGLEDLLTAAQKADGGVIFVDEAYQLVNDREGKKVLDYILPLAESLDSEFGPLVWVFAGYKKQMEKLFEHNEGLPSRFPQRFVFDDYSDEELQCIFEDHMKYQQSKPAAPKPQAAPTQAPRARYGSLGGQYGGYDGRTTAGQQKTDRFGRKWTFQDMSGWTDEFGNKTVEPDQVGQSGAELYSAGGGTWTEQGGTWTEASSGQLQAHYPGDKPAPSGKGRQRRSTPFRCENPDHLRIAIQRLGRGRGSHGFGNARAVRVIFEQVRDRQSARIQAARSKGQYSDIHQFVRTDLLGPDISKSSLKKSAAWQTLDQMEGLQPVKQSVEQLLQLVLNNVEREKKGQKLYEVTLNRLFLGNPGTGKTSVAELYGRILVDLGLLSKGDVILKCASDFVGDVLGSSEKITRSIIGAAQGNVLVIDEAYSLYSGGQGPSGSNDPYKTAVIDTIVEQVQSRPGADLAVVMLGYQVEMETMMSKVNPGLSRRFQVENAFHFPDFNDEALIRIMTGKACEQQLALPFDVAKRAVSALAKARAKPNFGNAGAVDNILSKAITRMQQRRPGSSAELTAEDFGCASDGPDTDVLDSLFSDLIGCDEVRETMDELHATVEFARKQGKPPASHVAFNYLFLGAPGTGKTTVARKMGKMFHALGLLPGDDLKEVKASDFVTGFTGQAGKQTRDILADSRGGVLFVDEAYQFDPNRGGSYMTEAVDELVGALTDEEFEGKLLVILAGYDEDMEAMLKTNPGLKSRFSERVHFRNFDANATVELLHLALGRQKTPLEAPYDDNDLKRLAQQLVDSEGFGNGRDVVTWADRVYKEVAKRSRNKSSFADFGVKKGGRQRETPSSLANIKAALKQILDSRVVRTGGPRCGAVPVSRGADATESASPPPPQAMKQRIEVAADEPEPEPEPEEEIALMAVDEPSASCFENVDPVVLTTLQRVLDEEGLNTEAGTQQLSALDPNGSEFARLAQRLTDELGLKLADSYAQLLAWQDAQKDLHAMVQQQRSQGARPIWRCAVCGRANKPWITCFVAPYIVGFEQAPLT